MATTLGCGADYQGGKKPPGAVAREYFERFPKDRYETSVESWRHLQRDNYEFTMRRLREPKD
jgi:hypothetical protein